MHLVCNGMRIRAWGRPVRAATRARFALQNFIFGQQELPDVPLNVDVRGLRVTITPVDDYITGSSRLRRYGGLAQTAWCDITDPAHAEGPLNAS
jgi:hypothetical protein